MLNTLATSVSVNGFSIFSIFFPEEYRSVYFVDKDGKKKLLTDEVWNALSSGTDEELYDSDEDSTFNPNVLLHRNQEYVSDCENYSESSEKEVNIQYESLTSGNKTIEKNVRKLKRKKLSLHGIESLCK